jgi:hypothetical protein
MTEQERQHWLSLKGRKCVVAYDPPDNEGIIIGVRRARSYPCNDQVNVRFSSGVLKAVRPHQIIEVLEASR